MVPVGILKTDVRNRSTILPSGRYKGYILETLPDDILETLWQELDGDNAYSRAHSRRYSEAEKELLILLLGETVQRWHQNRANIILPAKG